MSETRICIEARADPEHGDCRSARIEYGSRIGYQIPSKMLQETRDVASGARPAEGRRTVAESYVYLTLRYFQEEGQWVGDCEELGVARYGESLDEVHGLPQL